MLPLSPCRLRGGRVIATWLIKGDFDLRQAHSGLFEMEWPPRSGRVQRFPEFDRLAYFSFPNAMASVNRGQRPILIEAQLLLEGAAGLNLGDSDAD